MAGSIVFTFKKISPTMVEVKADCYAAADQSWPATVMQLTTPGVSDINLLGWYLYSVKAWPGGTAPTDGSDLTITDRDSVDLLGGRGTDLLDSTSKTSCAAGSVITAMPMPITGPITFNLSGNSVASAIVYLKVLFVAD